MRSLVVLGVFVLVTASPAAAKDIESIVVVGSDGRSLTIRPERGVLAVLLYHPASVYAVPPQPARPRGGYVKVYPLGSGGLPAIPGRFYPRTRALCFGWNQAVAPRACGRLGPPRRLLGASRRLALFRGGATVLAALHPGGTANLFAALELAFDRYRSARRGQRPARCLRFTATWYSEKGTQRLAGLCISRRSVYAGGRLYPTRPAVWWLARRSAAGR
jgi:hypothetical protein